jgi:hypothetical protein
VSELPGRGGTVHSPLYLRIVEEGIVILDRGGVVG